MKTRTLAAITCLLALGLAGALSAQTETNHLWPTFDVAIGSYTVSSSDEIRVDGSIEVLGREIDLNRDFGLGDRGSVLAGSFDWAFAEKHSIGLSTYAIQRDASRSIDRSIDLGGVTFPIGADAFVVKRSISTDLLAAVEHVRGHRSHSSEPMGV